MIEIVSRREIQAGWSGDKKYRVRSADGGEYLLRVTSGEKATSRRAMFEMQRAVAALGVPMCQPEEYWENAEGANILQRWVEGEGARDALPKLDPLAQYALGVRAGQWLNMIHSLPAPKEQPEWETRFNAKMDRKIELYRRCGLRFEGDEAMIAYMERHRALLRGRPQCLQHGDYHTGNMLIDPAGELVIIDFDRMDYGDPWEEFNRIVWCAQLSPAFASGMIDGYFQADVPQAFWQLMAIYICSNTLSSVAWAPAFGEREIQTMLNQAGDVVRWYDAMRSVVPTWYARPIGAHEMNREADA